MPKRKSMKMTDAIRGAGWLSDATQWVGDKISQVGRLNNYLKDKKYVGRTLSLIPSLSTLPRGIGSTLTGLASMGYGTTPHHTAQYYGVPHKVVKRKKVVRKRKVKKPKMPRYVI